MILHWGYRTLQTFYFSEVQHWRLHRICRQHPTLCVALKNYVVCVVSKVQKNLSRLQIVYELAYKKGVS